MSLSDRLAHHSIPEPNSGCLLWASAVNRKGYGHMMWRGKTHLAHRVAWACANGPIPAGLLICHRCDVPSCINPDHLFLGTNAANMADMVAKERQAAKSGELNGNAKLSASQAAEIRAATGTLTDVAARFGISKSMVSLIRRGEAWK